MRDRDVHRSKCVAGDGLFAAAAGAPTRLWHLVLPLLLATPAAAAVGETFGRESWWLPQNVFAAGDNVDRLFYFILYLTSGVCVAVFVVLVTFLVRYRHRPGQRPTYTHGNTRLEAVWTLVPTVILALTAAFSEATWSRLKVPPPPSEGQTPIEMEVIGRQFQWFFHYPGADGKLGPRRLDLIDRDASDFDALIGLDRDDPDARDDIVSPKMYIPVGTRVNIRLTSVDVIHSFFLPNFRVKQDAVPGLNGRVWIKAGKTSARVVGTTSDGRPKPFDIACAELCGQGHFKMRGQLYVVSRDEYDAFLKEEAEYLNLDQGDEYY